MAVLSAAGSGFAGPILTIGRGGHALFGTVTAPEGRRLQQVLATLPRNALAGLSPALVASLIRLDMNLPEHRVLLFPLQQARSVDARAERLLPEMLLLLDHRAEALVAAAERAEAAPAELETAAAEMAEYEPLAALYRPESLRAVHQARERAASRLDALRAAAIQGQVDKTAKALGLLNLPGPAVVLERRHDEAERNEASRSLTALSLMRDSGASDTVERLGAMAENRQDEVLQSRIILGLGKDLAGPKSAEYGEGVIAAIERIAAKTTHENVQALAVREALVGAARLGLSKSGVNAAERIARRGAGRGVKALAVRLLLEERERAGDSRYRAFLLASVERIRSSMGGAEAVPVPLLRREKALEVASFRGLKAQLSEGARNHPVAALLTALSFAGAFSGWSAAHLPVLGLLAAASALLLVAAKGLWMDYPAASALQVLLLGGFLRKAAVAGIGLGTAAAGLAAVGVALWSFRNGRTVAGVVANLVLLLCLFAVR